VGQKECCKKEEEGHKRKEVARHGNYCKREEGHGRREKLHMPL
jgi:hypothetical protein